MPIGLKEYNRIHNTSFNFDDMWVPELNEVVGKGTVIDLLRRYRGDYVKAINAYNMGMGNVDRNRWNDHYLKQIIPWKWHFSS